MSFSKKPTPRTLAYKDFFLSVINKQLGTLNVDLLEVGCANGRFADLLAPEVDSYTGIDPHEESIIKARETSLKGVKAEYLVGRAEDIPLDKQFDVLLYVFSWHFIKDFDKAAKEAARVLKPQGVLIIMDPSEETTSWRSPRLRRGTEEFDEELLTKKIQDLRRGRKNIKQLEQEGLRLLKENTDNGEKPNTWVFKKHENTKR